MSVLGYKRIFGAERPMSAFGGKADIRTLFHEFNLTTLWALTGLLRPLKVNSKIRSVFAMLRARQRPGRWRWARAILDPSQLRLRLNLRNIPKNEEEKMCDYSLEEYRSRPAREGERYVTHRFDSSSIGFASPGDCSTAVCVQADTRLRLQDIPAALQGRLKLGPGAEVTFVRLDHGRYRDGVKFKNGAQVLLQDLGPGVTAMIPEFLGQSAQPSRLVAAL